MGDEAGGGGSDGGGSDGGALRAALHARAVTNLSKERRGVLVGDVLA